MDVDITGQVFEFDNSIRNTQEIKDEEEADLKAKEATAAAAV